mgnify:CR=1 FL=1
MCVSCLQPDFDNIEGITDDDSNGSADVASPEVCGHEISALRPRLEIIDANVDSKLPRFP